MARYKVSFAVEGDNINRVRKRATEAFKGLSEDMVEVEKIRADMSRADRLGEAEDLASQAKDIVQELAEEMESWYDNLPENLRDGDKGTRIEECKDALEEIVSSLEECDFSSIDFPGMYE